MRIEYHTDTNDKNYISASPKEYALTKQKKCITREGTVYTLKGKSFAPISFLERIISGLFAAFLALCIIPLVFTSSRKYVRQLAKEAWTQKEKVKHYISTNPPPPQIKIPEVSFADRICENDNGLKGKLEKINSMKSACCVVQITVGGVETSRQYIFENKDGSSLDKNAINQRIDRIKNDLAKVTSLSKDFSYRWVILAKVEDKRQFYCVDQNVTCNANDLSGTAGGGESDGDDSLAHFDLYCKQFNIGKIYADGKFVKGPHYQEIN